MARRLERIYRLAAGTGHLARFIVYGSFVTAKPDPGDVDVFIVVADSFELARLSHEEKVLFDHMLAHPESYRLSAGGLLAEIDRMNREVRQYLSLLPAEVKKSA